MSKALGLATAIVFASISISATATPGGLDADGCHTDRKGGTGYHCHRPQVSVQTVQSKGAFGAFRNCAAARAAGAAPVRRGDAGYGAHLDRDNDGIGCE